MAGLASRITLGLFGAVLILFGLVGLVVSPVCGLAAALGFVVLLVAAIPRGAGRPPAYPYPPPVYYAPPPPQYVYAPPQTIIVQAPPQQVYERQTVREVVKIPCRYCGALVEATLPSCPRCAAPLR